MTKHLLLLMIVLGTLIWSGINPYHRGTWLLEVIPACIALLLFICTYKKFQFSTLSYLVMAILFVLIFIGGHYTYAEVPLFNWIQEKFNLERNYYDRVGHFVKGFVVIVFREFLLRRKWLDKGVFLNTVVISFVLSLAALYEIGEGLVAKVLGKSAKDFLGTQGDVWDSEWDMMLATVGAIVALMLLTRWQNKKLNNLKLREYS